MSIFILCWNEATKTNPITTAAVVNSIFDSFLLNFCVEWFCFLKLFNSFITAEENKSSTLTLCHVHVHLRTTTTLRLIYFDVYACFMLPVKQYNWQKASYQITMSSLFVSKCEGMLIGIYCFVLVTNAMRYCFDSIRLKWCAVHEAFAKVRIWQGPHTHRHFHSTPFIMCVTMLNIPIESILKDIFSVISTFYKGLFSVSRIIL